MFICERRNICFFWLYNLILFIFKLVCFELTSLCYLYKYHFSFMVLLFYSKSTHFGFSTSLLIILTSKIRMNFCCFLFPNNFHCYHLIYDSCLIQRRCIFPCQKKICYVFLLSVNYR